MNALYEDVELRDNPLLPEPIVTLTGVDTQQSLSTRALPELHGALRRLRAFVDRRRSDAILISEACVSGGRADRLLRRRREMHLPCNFFLA